MITAGRGSAPDTARAPDQVDIGCGGEQALQPVAQQPQKGVYEQALGLPSFDALIEQAQGGIVTLDDIARLTVFLASERSRFCTGGAYVVDGGLTASLL